MNFYIIIRGPLGSGKSTVSEQLAQKFDAELIPIDRVLDEHKLTKDKEDGYISQSSFKQANKIIAPEAQKLLNSGKIVIFDGNFYWKSQLDDLIQRLDFPHYVFTLKVELELCLERDCNREKMHGKDAAEAVYRKSTEFEYGIPIDASGSVNETIKNILFYIQSN